MSTITLSNVKLKKYEALLLDENVLFELNAIPQMIVNKDRVIIRANKKFTKLFGYTSEEILGQQTILLTPTNETFYQYAKYFSETKEGIIKSEELQYKKKDGSLFWVKLEGNPINQQEDELLILWSFIDVDKEVKYREELKLLASTDPMTKLLNRRFFADMADSFIELALRDRTDTSLFMLDIDKFKNVNDTYGHKVGDDVIIALAGILKEETRKSDLVSRWGGEEFVILLPNSNSKGAMKIAQKIRKTVENFTLILENAKTLHFTISLGVAQINLEIKESLEAAIGRADSAMYEAKESGRNRAILSKSYTPHSESPLLGCKVTQI